MLRIAGAFLLVFIVFSESARGAPTLSIGPEIYHLKRIRAGGTHQSGRIDGMRLAFNRIKGCSWYLGGDFLFAAGNLKGATITGRKVFSKLNDHIYEGRVGYTFGTKTCREEFFTPFLGVGHFREINDFMPPSPIPFTFKDEFNYVVAGFLSGFNFNSLLRMGLNFKLRFMYHGQSEVTNDPLFDDATLLMKDEIHARLDLPIEFNPCDAFFKFGFLFAPFYEYRHFGGREGYPFNFKDTKFYLYGAHFALTYRF